MPADGIRGRGILGPAKKFRLAVDGRRCIIGIFASSATARRTHGGGSFDAVGSTGRDSCGYNQRDVYQNHPMIPPRIIGQENMPAQTLQCFEEMFSLRAYA